MIWLRTRRELRWKPPKKPQACEGSLVREAPRISPSGLLTGLTIFQSGAETTMPTRKTESDGDFARASCLVCGFARAPCLVCGERGRFLEVS